MEVSSLQKNRPHLESVLGPLSPEDNFEIRKILDEVDNVLLEIAAYFGHDRAGWEGTGLELTWIQSGQAAISSSVGASNLAGESVDFRIELRPSWYFGEKLSKLGFDVELSVSADCRH